MAGNLDKVKSIVVLMLENRFFDNLLGYLYFAQGNSRQTEIHSTASPGTKPTRSREAEAR